MKIKSKNKIDYQSVWTLIKTKINIEIKIEIKLTIIQALRLIILKFGWSSSLRLGLKSLLRLN